MLVDQAPERVGAQVRRHARVRGEQQVVQQRAQGAAEPLVQWQGEALLRPVEQPLGDHVAEGLLEDPLE